MKENKKLIDIISEAIGKDKLCFCITGELDGEDMKTQCAINGDPEILATMIGGVIAEELGSASEEERNSGLSKFLAIENAVIALMAYNEKIYNHVMNHITEIPGKPIMFAQLNNNPS